VNKNAKPSLTLASIFKTMDVSGHRSVETLRGYVRDAELFKDHAGAGLLEVEPAGDMRRSGAG
jgi:hypothetical protein